MVVVAFAKRTTHDALDNDCREASFRQVTVDDSAIGLRRHSHPKEVDAPSAKQKALQMQGFSQFIDSEPSGAGPLVTIA
jgi:hypothetical protein